MFNLKKAVSVALIVLLMLGSILTGCGSDSREPAPATKETASSTTESTTESTETENENPYAMPYSGDPVTLTFMQVDYSTANNNIFEGRLQEAVLETLGNVKIQFDKIPEADQNTKMAVALSSGEMSDISIFIGSGFEQVPTYGGTGNLLDFSEYLEYMPNYAAQEKTYPYTFAKLGEKRYAINPINRMSIHNVGPVVNRYWVEKLGLKIPTPNNPDIPWTIDDMLDAMRQVKKAKPDIWSTFCSYFQGSRYLIELAQSYLGQWRAEEISANYVAAVYDYQDTQKWIYPIFTDAFRDMVEMTSIMYKEGHLPVDYATDSMDKHTANLVGSYDQWFIMWDFTSIGAPAINKLQQTEPTAGAYLILPPTTKYQPKPKIAEVNAAGSPFRFFIVVNANTKYPELACSVIDHLISPEVTDLINWGFEGETYKRLDGKGLFGIAEKEYLTDKYWYNFEVPSLLSVKQEVGLQTDQMRRMFSHAAGTPEGQISQMSIPNVVNPIHMGLDVSEETGYIALGDIYKYLEKNPDNKTRFILPPVVTEEEGKQISEIYTEINTVVKANLDKFTMGVRPMSEWDAFINELKKAGDPQIICDIYNSKELLPYINK